MLKTCRAFLPALCLFLLPAVSSAQWGFSLGVKVNVAPPELPVYEQPRLPAPGYIFVPGYWFWDQNAGDYVWIPGTWVSPPQPGVLWTPGYWGYQGGAYLWHGGYWGPQIGFYGGVNYGFGYTGNGYEGGRWQGNQFYYNRAVVNVGTTNVTNVYEKNVTVNNVTVNRTSFNGPGGVQARATPEQLAAEKEHHIPPSSEQLKHAEIARTNPELRAKANGGHPAIAATARPAVYKGAGVVEARGATAHPAAAERPAAARPETAHPEAAHPEAARSEAAHPRRRPALRRLIQPRIPRPRHVLRPRPVPSRAALRRRVLKPPSVPRPHRAQHRSPILLPLPQHVRLRRFRRRHRRVPPRRRIRPSHRDPRPRRRLIRPLRRSPKRIRPSTRRSTGRSRLVGVRGIGGYRYRRPPLWRPPLRRPPNPLGGATGV